MTADPLLEAAARVRAEGLIAYPTETTYGLGADATLGARRGRAPNLEGSTTHGSPSRFSSPERRCARRSAVSWDPRHSVLWLPSGRDPSPSSCVAARSSQEVLRAPGAPWACAARLIPWHMRLAVRLADEGLGPVTATSLNRERCAAGENAQRSARGLRRWLRALPGSSISRVWRSPTVAQAPSSTRPAPNRAFSGKA